MDDERMEVPGFSLQVQDAMEGALDECNLMSTILLRPSRRIENELIRIHDPQYGSPQGGMRPRKVATGPCGRWRQLKALEKYKRKNQKKYQKQFKSINSQIEHLIRQARMKGNMKQEIRILQAIRKGWKTHGQERDTGA
ncbi:MAG: hypothetical protein ACLT76_18360 [Clostridium fessum]